MVLMAPPKMESQSGHTDKIRQCDQAEIEFASMIELVLASHDLDAIRDELIGGPVESCAVLFANQTLRADGTVRLLVREVQFPTPADYSRQGPIEAELTPAFVSRVSKRARIDRLALVFVHSHPGIDPPLFSALDSQGEGHLARFLGRRNPDQMHAAVVISAGGMRARRLGTIEEI
jgi:hypothetical protein